ncbi:MAG: GNAT family N-acetyltransferase [Desulfobacterales bacterium]|nr:GNAT family N-acetyltransferase [Desulfobacterales bacterium]
MKIIAETQRLKIVDITINDIDLLYQLTGDKEVMKYFPKILNYDDTERMNRKILDHYKKYGYCYWKLLLKPKEEFIGITGLLHQEIDGKVETEIAFRIKPEHWNKGYATEAAGACKDYGETALGKKGLISLIHPKNQASKRVAQKLGAQKTKSVQFMGHEHEVYIY